MFPHPKTKAELQNQRSKIVNSYNLLLEEFSSKELRSVGNYNVGALIGKGSFGKVYLASHKFINGSKVVLKQARKAEANLPREIHHHRQFFHPHIARLYEVIITEDSVWLVLEYCPGDELFHYLTKHGPIDPPIVQKIFTQLVGAVSYVHGKSCVHRDLKLENILLDKHDNVKLCDFGFTREYEGKSSYLQTWCGTVCYSAPEMLKGEKYAGEKVDVWSLGVILYALLCGQLPFDEDDENATKAIILKEEPKYPETMPQGAKDLIAALLSKRPIIRPSLADILTNPWLAEHAPQQQAILKLQQLPPFTSQLESNTLDQMRGAGISTESVKEHVQSQRCDALAGWWALLLEKEERRDKRRQRRRREKDLEGRASRRVSTASNFKLEGIIKESEEEQPKTIGLVDPVQARGRDIDRRNGSAVSADLKPPSAPPSRTASNGSPRAPPRLAMRPASAARRRSQYALVDSKRHSSTLHMVISEPALLVPDLGAKPGRKRYQQPLLNPIATIKQWFRGPAKPKKRGVTHVNFAQPTLTDILEPQKSNGTAAPASVLPRPYSAASGSLPPSPVRGVHPSRPRLATSGSMSSQRRLSSQSSSPMTPQSSYYRRNTSTNVRDRASTSSSISSAPDIHTHRPSPSKPSSASSSSLASPQMSSSNLAQRRSNSKPSVKVLPAPLAGSTLLPSSVRVVKPSHIAVTEGNAAFSTMAPPSPGLLFAKRKRTPFKGPMLGPGIPASRRRSEPHGSRSRNNSITKRPGGEVPIQEEDEDDVEEVDYFSPVTGPGEFVGDEQFPTR